MKMEKLLADLFELIELGGNVLLTGKTDNLAQELAQYAPEASADRVWTEGDSKINFWANYQEGQLLVAYGHPETALPRLTKSLGVSREFLINALDQIVYVTDNETKIFKIPPAGRAPLRRPIKNGSTGTSLSLVSPKQ